jgi:hypothetical protein
MAKGNMYGFKVVVGPYRLMFRGVPLMLDVSKANSTAKLKQILILLAREREKKKKKMNMMVEMRFGTH